MGRTLMTWFIASSEAQKQLWEQLKPSIVLPHQEHKNKYYKLFFSDIFESSVAMNYILWDYTDIVWDSNQWL